VQVGLFVPMMEEFAQELAGKVLWYEGLEGRVKEAGRM
jgi:hypothetical protein